MNLLEAKKQYMRAKDAYYNSKAIMSDAEFDGLEDFIKREDPKWSELKKTGIKVAAINKKQEITHTHFMPSAMKKYPEAIDAWLAKNLRGVGSKQHRAIIMHKLDGTSLKASYQNGVPFQLVTRGNGAIGQDISYLIPFVNIPKRIPHLGRLVLRIEAIMPNEVFEKKWKTRAAVKAMRTPVKRTKDEFDDARGMVNGLFNRQLKDGKAHAAFKDIEMRVLGIYGMTFETGLWFADKQKFDVVPYHPKNIGELTPTQETLNLSKLLKMAKASDLACDGLCIVHPDQKMEYKDNKKPKWMAAYKENDLSGAVPVTVKRIQYQISGNNRINMKAIFEPTKIGTVMVKHATLHNAQWMIDRGIGPGAEILVLRSGDVIPKVVGVIKKAKVVLPEVPHYIKGKFFYAKSDSKDAKVERIQKFMVTLGIEGIKDKSIAKLFDAGFETYYDYIKAWSSRTGLAKAVAEAGFGTANSKKLQTEFDRVFDSGVPIARLMVASSKFVGVGMERMQKVEKHWSSNTNNPLRNFIMADEADAARYLDIPTIKEKTAAMFLENRLEFRKILAVLSKHFNIVGPETKKVVRATSNELAGEVVSFTSYRDLAHEARVQQLGATVAKYGSKTTILLYKEGGKKSDKVQKAKDLGKRVCTFEELMEKN